MLTEKIALSNETRGLTSKPIYDEAKRKSSLVGCNKEGKVQNKFEKVLKSVDRFRNNCKTRLAEDLTKSRNSLETVQKEVRQAGNKSEIGSNKFRTSRNSPKRSGKSSDKL